MRTTVYLLLLLLYVLHTDVWYWDDPRIVLGLPIGVTYHVLWTLAVTAAFWMAVRWAWPEDLEAPDPAGDGAPPFGRRGGGTVAADASSARTSRP